MRSGLVWIACGAVACAGPGGVPPGATDGDVPEVDAAAPPDATGGDDAPGAPDAGPQMLCGPITFDVEPYTSPSEAVAGAIAEIDGDGVLDVVVAVAPPSLVRVYHGVGGGALSAAGDHGDAGRAGGVIVADLDSDGAGDVIVYGAEDGFFGDPRILWNDGPAGFVYVQRTDGDEWVNGVVAADLDGDGDVDLAASHSHFPDVPANGVTLYLNEGARAFSRGTSMGGAYPSGLAKGDFDGDGALDLATTEFADVGLVQLYSGDGAGAFMPGPLSSLTPAQTAAPSPADFDEDGDLDLALADPTGASIVVVGNHGHGIFGNLAQFGVPMGAQPTAIEIADLNGDGHADLAFTQGTPSGDLGIAQGRGDGTFCPPLTIPLDGDFAGSLDSGDLDGDGRQDLVVTTGGSDLGTFVVLRNTTP
jgi:hypothetical protein